VDSFDVFPDDNVDSATLGITPERRYFLEYIYLVDTDPSNVIRNLAYRDEQSASLVTQADGRPMLKHDVALDFNLTGRPFQEVTDSANALLNIEGDFFTGNYRIFAQSPDQVERLRGASVFAVFDFDEGVQNIEIDRYDGQGHILVDKAEASEGVHLGEIDFGGFKDGNIRFYFNDDPERHNGDRVTITELIWRVPGAKTELTTAVNIPFEFSAEPTGGNQDPQGNNFQAVGAKTGKTPDGRAYIDIWFNEYLRPDSQDFPYLVRLERSINHVDESASNQDMVTASAGIGSFTEQRAVELLYDGIVKNKLRAFFNRSTAVNSAIIATGARFNLTIEADFTQQRPTGVHNIDGELLHFTFLNIGNLDLYSEVPETRSNLLPTINLDNAYVFSQFSDGSIYLSPTVTANLTRVSTGVFKLGSFDGSMNRHFRLENKTFEYCGESGAPSPCVTLWRQGSTLGSAIGSVEEGFVRVSEFMDVYYAGGLNFTDTVGIEWIKREGENAEKHHMFFANHVGLVSHTTSYLSNQSQGFKGLEIAGYKIGDKQLGNLAGLSGVQFNGVEVEMSFIVPAGENELALSEGRSPYKMGFFQKMNDGSERVLSFSLNQALETTVPIEVTPGSENVYFLAFSKATSTNLDGIRLEGETYNIVARLADSSNERVRNIDLSKDLSFLYWFIDFAQEVGGESPRLRSGELNSFLKSKKLGQGDTDWDLRLESEGTSTLPELNLVIRGSMESGGNSGRLMRRVESEFSFGDALSLPTARITTNGLAHQQNTTALTMVNENFPASPGDLYLILIPREDRQKIIGGAPGSDIYVLMLIKDMDPFEGVVEMDFALSTDVAPDGVSFFNRPVNEGDPEFIQDEDTAKDIPSRSNYMNLYAGQCVDMEVDPYDFNSGWDENRPAIVCEEGTDRADFSVDMFRLVSDPARVADNSSYHGIVELNITVPGGYEPAPFPVDAHKGFSFALHPSLLAKTGSQTGIDLDIPYDVFFRNGFCELEMPPVEPSFYGRENLIDGNDFIFQFGIRVDLHGDSGSNSGITTSVYDCVERAQPVMDFHYKYYGATRPVDGLMPISHRGDFSGSGRRHPLADFDDIQGLQSYVPNMDNPDNNLIVSWQSAADSISPGMISTFYEGCSGETSNIQNDPNCQGKQWFRFETLDHRFENWGARVDFHVEGAVTNGSSTLIMESNSARSYRQDRLTTSSSSFRLGIIDGGSSDPNLPLFINFGPQWVSFSRMVVDQLELSIPLSKLKTSIGVNKSLLFNPVGQPGQPDLTLVDFDPSVQATPFATAELGGDGDVVYHVLDSRDGIAQLEFLTFNPQTGLSGSCMIKGESCSFGANNETLTVDSPSLGIVSIHKAGAGISIPSDGTNTPPMLVMVAHEGGKFSPELWFKDSAGLESFKGQNLFSEIFSGGASEPIDPSPSQGQLEESLRIIGVKAMSSGAPVELHFSKNIPTEMGQIFKPASVENLKAITVPEDFQREFSPGKFVVFRGLDFVDIFRILNWDHEGQSSVAAFVGLITELFARSKVVNLGDGSKVSSGFKQDSHTSAQNHSIIEIYELVAGSPNNSGSQLDAMLGENYLIWVSPLLEGEDTQELNGVHGFGKTIDMRGYTSRFADLDHILGLVEMEGDFQNHFTIGSNTVLNDITLNVTASETSDRYILRTTATITPNFIDDLNLTEHNVRQGARIATDSKFLFSNKGVQTLFLQEVFAPMGQDPRLKMNTALWRLPNNGALFFIGDYEYPYNGSKEDIWSVRGRLENGDGMADTDYNFSEPIFWNDFDFSSGADINFNMTVGQFNKQSLITEVRSNATTSVMADTWWGARDEVTTEILTWFPAMSLKVNDETTSIQDVLAIRFSSRSYSVKSTQSADGPWVKTGDENGVTDEDILFFSPKHGLFLSHMNERSLDGYCTDNNGSQVFNFDENSMCNWAIPVAYQFNERKISRLPMGWSGFNENLLSLAGSGSSTQTSSVPLSGYETLTYTIGSATDTIGYSVSYNGMPHLDPDLILYRGSTYIFNIDALGHPFRIVDANGQHYLDGLSGNGISQGMTTDRDLISLTFKVPETAPGTLYYECTNPTHQHGGALLIKDPPFVDPSVIRFDVVAHLKDFQFTSNQIGQMHLHDPGSFDETVGETSTPLILYRGYTYEFYIHALDHSFHIAYPLDKGGADLLEMDGVFNNGAIINNGSEGDITVVTFAIDPYAVFNELRFYSTENPELYGTIRIENPELLSTTPVQSPLRVQSIQRVVNSNGNGFKASFNKDVTGASSSDFSPVSVQGLIDGLDANTLTSPSDVANVFGTGKFLVFKGLRFRDLIELFSFNDISAPDYVADFKSFLEKLQFEDKIVDFGGSTPGVMLTTRSVEIALDLPSGEDYLVFFSPFHIDENGSPLQGYMGISDREITDLGGYFEDNDTLYECKRGIYFDGGFNSILNGGFASYDPTEIPTSPIVKGTCFRCTIFKQSYLDDLATKLGGNDNYIDIMALQSQEIADLVYRVEGTVVHPGSAAPYVQLQLPIDILGKMNNGSLIRFGKYDYFNATPVGKFVNRFNDDGTSDAVDPVRYMAEVLLPSRFNLSNGNLNGFIKLGEDVSHSFVASIADSGTGGWEGEYVEQSSEPIAFIPSVEMMIGGTSLILTDVIVLRSIEYSYPVKLNSAHPNKDISDWYRDDSANGAYVEKLRFMARGIGEFLLVETHVDGAGKRYTSGIIIDGYGNFNRGATEMNSLGSIEDLVREVFPEPQ